MRETKEAKLARLLEREKALLEAGATVAGIDEVGRGPLAGPVVAACVAMKPGCWVPGVDYSKKLTEKRREALYPLILENSLYARTAWVWPGEIDALNILNATRRAMEEAARGLPGAIFLVDAVTGLDLPGAIESIVHGDAQCYSIAAASIVAKVERDRYMVELDARYPQYGFAQNKGYGTAQHMAALRECGPCPEHRKSFIRFLASDAPRR